MQRRLFLVLIPALLFAQPSAEKQRRIEQGKINLDAEVRRYLPGFPKKQWPITIRELLGHQSGIRHYCEDGSDLDSTTHYSDRIEPLKIFKEDPLLSSRARSMRTRLTDLTFRARWSSPSPA